MGTCNERVEISYKNDLKVLAGILFACAITIWFISWLVKGHVLVAIAPVLLFEAVRLGVSNFRGERGRKTRD